MTLTGVAAFVMLGLTGMATSVAFRERMRWREEDEDEERTISTPIE